MNDKLNELSVTVCKETRQTLDALASSSGLTLGEVLDRMVLAVSPSKVDNAHLLILDQILIATNRLNQEQFNEVILKVLKTLEEAFSQNEHDEITRTLTNIVEKLTINKFKNLTNNSITFHKIKTVTPLENYILEVQFIEGVTKRYDVKPLLDELPYFNELKENDLFFEVKNSSGGYGVIWNDRVDLSCNELWENGTLC